MSHGQRIVYSVFVVVLVSPVFPLLFAWARLIRRTAADIPRLLLLFLVLLTCSCGLLITAFFFKGALGPSYSMGRLSIIGANWFLALLGIIFVAVQQSNTLKVPLLLSASLLLVIWSLNAALSSAV
jgi:hypothetical protein